ncbi:hypothetical protein C8F04DRAFT_1183749 [Mycena alexandri]|uniref:Uncharacterized protein n=1 Tax=Mycena alexandri TaxID=1745969 RepID=A0AAD6SVC3_9AGAR|nr:hypothetical protein C8F04DRAFT_1183749 [Mycena alexandri]
MLTYFVRIWLSPREEGTLGSTERGGARNATRRASGIHPTMSAGQPSPASIHTGQATSEPTRGDILQGPCANPRALRAWTNERTRCEALGCAHGDGGILVTRATHWQNRHWQHQHRSVHAGPAPGDKDACARRATETHTPTPTPHRTRPRPAKGLRAGGITRNAMPVSRDGGRNDREKDEGQKGERRSRTREKGTWEEKEERKGEI